MSFSCVLFSFNQCDCTRNKVLGVSFRALFSLCPRFAGQLLPRFKVSQASASVKYLQVTVWTYCMLLWLGNTVLTHIWNVCIVRYISCIWLLGCLCSFHMGGSVEWKLDLSCGAAHSKAHPTCFLKESDWLQRIYAASLI